MALTKVKLIADGTIVQSHLNASHGITTADIGENASYLYYTDARARAAISVSGNALSYNSSTGVITSNFEENPVFTTGVTVANDSGHFTLFRTDGVTQLGKLYDDSGFTIEGKANNNLILRTKANSLGEGIKFQDTSSNDLMFIDGTNGQVGIGETSPASTLVVRKDNAGGRGGEITILNYATNTIGNEAALNFGLEDSTYAGDVGNAQIKALTTASNAASDIVFSTWNGSSFGERMRINSSGNVGIGEIPSNWSTFTVLQVEKASLASTGGDMNLMSNSYYDGTAYKYIESNAAARQYYNTDGTMHFYNASIGTAGGTVTWNERMRIDSSGLATFKKSGTNARFYDGSTSSTGAIEFGQSDFIFGYDSGVFKHKIWDGSDYFNAIEYNGPAHRLILAPSEGSVGIGATDPVKKLDVRGQLAISNSASSYWYLDRNDSTGNFEILTDTNSSVFNIDTSGNVGIGTTLPNYKLEVAGTIGTEDRLAIQQTQFGYSSSYKVVQFGNAAATSAISLGYNPSGNTNGGFTGDEILIPHNKTILAPNAADNSYYGVLRFNNDKLLIGSSNYAIASSYIMALDPATQRVGIGIASPGYKLDVYEQVVIR